MSIDMKLFDSVCARAREAMMLHSVADTLEWDERTGLPAAAGEYRAAQISKLRAMTHQIRTHASYGEDLQRLTDDVSDEDPHGDIAATIRGLYRDWKRERTLPTDLVQRTAEATVRGQQTWDAARTANDFGMFRDILAKVIDLKREAGQRISEGTDRTPYEALLDEYEPDARVDELQKVFDNVRASLVELIARIADAPKQPDTSVIQRTFNISDQRDFSHGVAENVGFDFDRGRLDETSHPFCTTLGPNDCRILTRYDPHWIPSGLFGTLHEAGHGLYEQGLRGDWFGLPPGSYASLGIHESQSRLWENQVGRSRSFWQWLYGDLQQTFSPELDQVSLDTFHFAVNAIRPSLIRVEADEATYNLHIAIRFELERDLIGGLLSVDDLPIAWNEKYEKYLGVTPPSAADGVLQDIHWSSALMGYFPTYALGNLYAAQFFEQAQKDIPDLDRSFQRGEFTPLKEWLGQRIHREGRRYSADELVKRVTGRPLGSESLLRYLHDKLHPLFGLDDLDLQDHSKAQD
jgi:carboxypeptidase Taq